jgi:hypothetical protein
MTIAAYVVKISRLLYLFSMSNKWTYPNLNVYLFNIERQCGLGKKPQFNVLRRNKRTKGPFQKLIIFDIKH